MSAIIESPWMDVNEAAAYMRRHPVTVRKDLESERLLGYQRKAPNGHWRIHRDDCDRFLRGERPLSVAS
ncbi:MULTISPECIES: helix-turn-helix domain-containing protein [unclassified Rhodococcus (in: high G+C Gram-positive bacteria)]|uniref:helix-turn-helix domain-containing protein n=1 Tax=unclassified Rhodococcus (in: high G+C Gram-positive bacteria) TaxID=192944 RepID=UPI0009BAED52|nr:MULTISPECIES: helix-turn-helix domain-containing protein [unclassified Rhodococcus (in: high G+C Gram-positive bacteria)]OQM82079.1 hypothetical protein B0E55_01704 [Rhodococcus sp. 66b]